MIRKEVSFITLLNFFYYTGTFPYVSYPRNIVLTRFTVAYLICSILSILLPIFWHFHLGFASEMVPLHLIYFSSILIFFLPNFIRPIVVPDKIQKSFKGLASFHYRRHLPFSIDLLSTQFLMTTMAFTFNCLVLFSRAIHLAASLRADHFITVALYVPLTFLQFVLTLQILSFVTVFKNSFDSLLHRLYVSTRKKSNINHLVEDWDSLTESCNLFTAYFAPQFLFLVGHKVLIMIMSTFLSTILIRDNYYTLPLVLDAIVQLVTIIITCQLTSRKASEFTNTLYSYSIKPNYSHLTNDRKTLIHLLQHKDLVFSVCGFFEIDCNLLISIVSSCTTYLVILHQL